MNVSKVHGNGVVVLSNGDWSAWHGSLRLGVVKLGVNRQNLAVVVSQHEGSPVLYCREYRRRVNVVER